MMNNNTIFQTDSSHFNKDNHISRTITILDENACCNHFAEKVRSKCIIIMIVLLSIFCTVIICCGGAFFYYSLLSFAIIYRVCLRTIERSKRIGKHENSCSPLPLIHENRDIKKVSKKIKYNKINNK